MTEKEGTNVATVEFSARVPQSEYLRFKERFPQYGASQWFINAALRAFNDRVADSPSLEEVVNDSIQAALDINKLIAQATKAVGREVGS